LGLSGVYLNSNLDLNSRNDLLASSYDDGRMTRSYGHIMIENSLYKQICDYENLFLAYKKARKGKTKKRDICEFEVGLRENIYVLHLELKNQTYSPKPLVTFILRDPKTRKISKSDFRDRIVHHAIINVIGPIFEKSFIYDSCANLVDKGTLFAIKRLDYFKRKVTHNLKSDAFCLKADIKHYFQEVDLEILMSIIKRRITDDKVLWLIEQILANSANGGGRTTFRYAIR